MSDLFVEIARTSTPKAIEEQIKGLIVGRQLVAGDALPPEREFAARLGVSRSTLREALRALTEEGIVAGRQGLGVARAAQPRHGGGQPRGCTSASRTSPSTSSSRRGWPTSPRSPGSRRSGRTDAELEAIAAAVHAMDDVTSPEDFLRADTEFHALVAAAAHNVLLSFQMTPTMSLLEDARRDIVATPEARAASQAEHRRIAAAIRARDGDATERAMRDHIAAFAARGATRGRRVERADLHDHAAGPGQRAAREVALHLHDGLRRADRAEGHPPFCCAATR